ncbi:peptidase inhibitor family I36 protein [Parasphingorhabdus pacifica]
MPVAPPPHHHSRTFDSASVRTRPEPFGATFRQTAAKTATAVLLAAACVPAGGVLAHAADQDSCRSGSFCAWGANEFRGQTHKTTLEDTEMETCVALPEGLEASSFVNRTGHPVTVYQDPLCDTHADFSTYPSETHVPNAPYVARAIKVWSH